MCYLDVCVFPWMFIRGGANCVLRGPAVILNSYSDVLCLGTIAGTAPGGHWSAQCRRSPNIPGGWRFEREDEQPTGQCGVLCGPAAVTSRQCTSRLEHTSCSHWSTWAAQCTFINSLYHCKVGGWWCDHQYFYCFSSLFHTESIYYHSLQISSPQHLCHHTWCFSVTRAGHDIDSLERARWTAFPYAIFALHVVINSSLFREEALVDNNLRVVLQLPRGGIDRHQKT